MKSLNRAEKTWEVAGRGRVFPPDTLDRHKSSPGHRWKYEGESDEFLDFIAFVFNTVCRITSNTV